jgi:hypothetical protein
MLGKKWKQMNALRVDKPETETETDSCIEIYKKYI